MALGAAACAVLAGPAGAADRPDPKQAWALWRAASPVATAAGYIPGLPPELCVGDIWSDQIGTNGEDALEAPNRAQRLWGRSGADYLYGSETRAACLIGGRDPDTLDLWLGGGAAWGEHGSDEIFGSPLDDILDGGDGNDVLVGGDGGDAINGGLGVDGIDGGAGDDMIDTNDGRGEVVRCGDGIDEVVTDGLDALVDCELGWRQGGGAVERLVPSPQAAQSSSVVRFRWTVPEAAGANAYKVVLLSSCAGAPSVLTSFPARGTRVKAGQRVRVGLRPPGNRWCRGKVQTAVTVSRRCSSSRGCASAPPPEVLARLSFRAR